MSEKLKAALEGLSPTPVEAVIRPVNWQLDHIVEALRGVRAEWRSSTGRARELGGRELPSRQAISEIIQGLSGALFPMRLGPNELREESEDFYVGHTLDTALNSLDRKSVV